MVTSHSWRKQRIKPVARRLEMGENTLRRMVARKEVEAVDYNGVRYIPPRAEQLLREHLGLAAQAAEATAEHKPRRAEAAEQH
jgi:hypothetical protein